MSPEPHITPGARERELFLGALEKTSTAERRAFLDAACGADLELRKRLEELLAGREEIGSFLEQPAMFSAQSDTVAVPAVPGGAGLLATVTEKAGDRIGRYKLLQQIGEGGCGVVYMAEQETPVRRRVALKVIKLGMDTKSVIARFEAERQALAMMDHPNIARVLDAGATEAGRPYFVMELVRGVKITEYCDANQLSTEERLALFIQICQAIQHAHQKGIIHRDIKPSNILVTLHDGTPVPKVIDFGIAKATEQRLTDKTLFTEFQAFIGTPAYMSPEQAQMTELDIDTRSDIYSLGVLLYELLTGRTPFDAEVLFRGGIDECRRTIREQEPERPSTRLATMLAAELTTTASQRRTDAPRLIHLLAGDLDWIVMKCLEKDRTRRFASASDVALDVQRYLADEPVLARPPSTVYRLQKLLRRHRFVVGAVSGVALALLAGAGISIWQAVRATRAENQARDSEKQEALLRLQAEDEKAAARLNEYIADMGLAQQSIAAGNYGRAVQLVEKHRPKGGEPDLRGFEWRYLWQLARGSEHTPLPTQESSVLALAVSPDGTRLAVGLREQLRVYDLRTQAVVASLPKGAVSLAFLPDGKSLVSASRSTVRVWRTQDWTQQTSLPEASGAVAVSPDGKYLATQGPGGVRVWDTATWQEVRSFRRAGGSMVFSPDGATLATDSRTGITLWPLEEGRAEMVLKNSTNLFWRGPMLAADRTMTFSRDGKLLVAPRNGVSERGVFVLSVWNTESGEEVAVLPGDPERSEHISAITSLILSPDGHTLATASFDHSIRLWDLDKQRLIRVLHGHLNEVWAIAFSPDGSRLLSGAKDGGLNLWPTREPPEETLLPEGWAPLAFSQDSRTLAALKGRHTLGLINLTTHEAEQELALETAEPPFERRRFGPMASGPMPPGPFGPGAGSTLALSADLRLVAHGRGEGGVQFWDTGTSETTTLKTGDLRVDFLALSPDGKVLITGGRDQPLSWWEPASRTNALLTIDAASAVFSANGRTLVALGRGNAAQVWDVPSRSVRTNLVIEPPPSFSLALSPDGRILATTAGIEDFDNAIYLWQTGTGKFLGACEGHKQPVVSVAFAPDGKTLASSGADNTVKFWNVPTQQEFLSIQHLGTTLNGLLFSPDGRLLIGRGNPFGQPIKLWVHRAPALGETDAPPREAKTTP